MRLEEQASVIAGRTPNLLSPQLPLPPRHALTLISTHCSFQILAGSFALPTITPQYLSHYLAIISQVFWGLKGQSGILLKGFSKHRLCI